MPERVLATVRASSGRRWFGIGILAGAGVLMIYVSVVRPPDFGWQVFLLGTGAVTLWLAERMRRATDLSLELTETELRDSAGRRLALVADIEGIDRGTFAFKPSNGFLLKTKMPGARVWQPGLWWRLGRRVGVGGVTPAAQTKAMSEMISAMLATRDQDAHFT